MEINQLSEITDVTERNVDTHVKRLSRRFAFTRSDDPVRIERDLMKLLPKQQWPTASLSIILHGRRVCDALRPRCAGCRAPTWRHTSSWTRFRTTSSASDSAWS